MVLEGSGVMLGGAGVVVSRVGGFGDSVTEGGGDRDGERESGIPDPS